MAVTLVEPQFHLSHGAGARGLYAEYPLRVFEVTVKPKPNAERVAIEKTYNTYPVFEHEIPCVRKYWGGKAVIELKDLQRVKYPRETVEGTIVDSESKRLQRKWGKAIFAMAYPDQGADEGFPLALKRAADKAREVLEKAGIKPAANTVAEALKIANEPDLFAEV
jgi:hypothetical protein